jgi:hypothetical protein
MSKMGVQNRCPKISKKSSKKSSKKVQKKSKKSSKKVQKKVRKIIIKNYKLLESGEGGELSFQCLRPSTSLMAAGKKCCLL